MKALLTAALLSALTGAARAQPTEPAPRTEAPPPPKAEAPPPPKAEAPPPAPTAGAPATAVAAIDRANAAYEYGDMKEVVDATRPVVDGAIEAAPAERLQALRLLGIGLYLTGRPTGAEAAFFDLLRARPKARLDPTTTRPEVVAFFEDVRRRHHNDIQDAARARSRKSMVWAFLPPVGQFKNGDPGRGAVFLTLEVASAATAITTLALLEKWRLPHNESTHPETARTLRTVNFVSVGVLAATYATGVIDALVRSDREPDDEHLSLFIVPGGLGLSGRF
jgi:hypothetical protein